MITVEVYDVTRGHCVGAITKAAAFVDPDATVRVNLASHRVQIEPIASTADVLSDAIKVAEYTPVAVGGAAVEAAPRKGCCCG